MIPGIGALAFTIVMFILNAMCTRGCIFECSVDYGLSGAQHYSDELMQ